MTTHPHLNGSGQATYSGTVTADGVTVGYDSFGAGADTVVLLPALLMSRRMQAPLARSLALRHIRVICLDYLGSRADGAPQEPESFSTDRLGALVVTALDELGVDRAVIGGTSIGSNIAVEAALEDPGRFTGVLLEGPFLEHAQGAMALAFSTLFALVTFGAPALRLASRIAPSALLERFPSMVIEDPALASAFMKGLLFGRMGPPREERRTVQVPALVIGFRLPDPFHPQRDASRASDDIPHARLTQTLSIADLRLRPERLAGEIARFIGDCRRRVQAHDDQEVAV